MFFGKTKKISTTDLVRTIFLLLFSNGALELVSNADNFPKHEVGMATMSSHNLSSLYGLV